MIGVNLCFRLQSATMKKVYLTILALLSAIQYSYAQKILFKEDFNRFNSYNISGWGKSYTGAVPWQAGEMYLVNGECFVGYGPDSFIYRRIAGICECGMIERNNSNVFTYTPKINTVGRNNLWLKVDAFFNKNTSGGKTEKFTIEVSTNGGTTWTVVKDMPAKTKYGSFDTYFIDLSAYINVPDLRIGFRYSDDGGSTMGGCAFDDVMVFEAEDYDLQLKSVSPFDTLQSYTAIGTGIPHTFNIFNIGLDTIKDFIIQYRQDGWHVISDTITGVNIPRFTGISITHKTPDTMQSAIKNYVAAWIKHPNDNNKANDTAYTSIRGAYFIPKKTVALEEGTGTWNSWSPRGIVYMQQIESGDYNVCQIAVHDTDPMAIEEYNDYLYYLRQIFVPYFLIDRKIVPEPDSIYSVLKQREKAFGFAEVKAGSYVDGNKLSIVATIKPAIDLRGDYRVIMVLTEDKLSGTDSKWSQKNKFAGGIFGPMGGFENKPDPVPATDMVYNYVARAAMPNPDGLDNLPDTLTHNQVYTVKFDTTLSREWNKNNMHAHILLFRHDDSTILNAVKIPFKLSVKNINYEESIDAWLYPNPAGMYTTLEFNLLYKQKASIYITDISGRLITQTNAKEYEAGINKENLQISNLQNGIYFITIATEEAKRTMKLQVLR